MRPTARALLISAARAVVGYWDQLNDMDPDELRKPHKVELDARVERLREALDRVRC